MDRRSRSKFYEISTQFDAATNSFYEHLSSIVIGESREQANANLINNVMHDINHKEWEKWHNQTARLGVWLNTFICNNMNTLMHKDRLLTYNGATVSKASISYELFKCRLSVADKTALIELYDLIETTLVKSKHDRRLYDRTISTFSATDLFGKILNIGNGLRSLSVQNCV